jgi:hypothetical protein
MDIMVMIEEWQKVRFIKVNLFQINRKKIISYNSKRKHFFHSEETKKKISIKCKAKFTIEYKKRIRKKLEDAGKIIPLSKIEDYIFYKVCANWIDSMFSYVHDPFQLEKLKTYKVFNSFTNKIGCVRDHMYSRRSGWENKVFPEILRHPSNMSILLHSENLSKKKYRYVDQDSHSLNDLFSKIEDFKEKWIEQDKVLEMISKYKDGYRYDKEQYIDEFYSKAKI